MNKGLLSINSYLNNVTPLMEACKANHFEIAQFLLSQCNANPNLYEKNGNLGNDPNNGATTMYWAAFRGNLKLLKLLAQYEFDFVRLINKVSGKYKHSAFLKLCFNGNVTCLQWLLNKCQNIDKCKLDILKADSGGDNALHLSIDQNQYEMVEFLINHVYFPNNNSNYNDGKIDYIHYKKNKDGLAAWNWKNKRGLTPYQYCRIAAFGDNTNAGKIEQFLSEFEEKLNKKNNISSINIKHDKSQSKTMKNNIFKMQLSRSDENDSDIDIKADDTISNDNKESDTTITTTGKTDKRATQETEMTKKEQKTETQAESPAESPAQVQEQTPRTETEAKVKTKAQQKEQGGRGPSMGLIMTHVNNGDFDAFSLEWKACDDAKVFRLWKNLMYESIRQERFEMIDLMLCHQFVSLDDAFLLACCVNNTKVIKHFIDKKVNVNFVDRSDNTTALYWAAFHGNLQFMKLLLEHGCDFKAFIDICDKRHGLSVFLGVCLSGNVECLDFLLNMDDLVINFIHRDNGGNSGLHLAIKKERVEMIKYLLENVYSSDNIDINIDILQEENNNGLTPIEFAKQVMTAMTKSDSLKKILKILKKHDRVSDDEDNDCDNNNHGDVSDDDDVSTANGTRKEQSKTEREREKIIARKIKERKVQIKQCPVCTLHNKETAQVCSICYTQLKSVAVITVTESGDENEDKDCNNTNSNNNDNNNNSDSNDKKLGSSNIRPLVQCIKLRNFAKFKKLWNETKVENIWIPLIHEALSKDQTKIIELMLENEQVNIDLALVYACQFNNNRMIKYLLNELNARPNAVKKEDNTTTMYWAAINANLRVMILLSEKGFDYDKLINHCHKKHSGKSVFLLLCSNGNVECLDYILQQCSNNRTKYPRANVNIFATTQDGENGLHLAIDAKRDEMVNYLLENVYFDDNRLSRVINNGNRLGLTPTHYAAAENGKNCLNTFKLLLKHQGDVNQANQYGTLPIHIACQRNCASILTFMLDSRLYTKKELFSQTTSDGLTPLGRATKANSKKCIDIFVGYFVKYGTKNDIERILTDTMFNSNINVLEFVLRRILYYEGIDDLNLICKSKKIDSSVLKLLTANVRATNENMEEDDDDENSESKHDINVMSINDARKHDTKPKQKKSNEKQLKFKQLENFLQSLEKIFDGKETYLLNENETTLKEDKKVAIDDESCLKCSIGHIMVEDIKTIKSASEEVCLMCKNRQSYFEYLCAECNKRACLKCVEAWKLNNVLRLDKSLTKNSFWEKLKASPQKHLNSIVARLATKYPHTWYWVLKSSKQLHWVTLFLRSGANANTTFEMYDNKTPMHVAVERENLEMMKELIRYRYDMSQLTVADTLTETIATLKEAITEALTEALTTGALGRSRKRKPKRTRKRHNGNSIVLSLCERGLLKCLQLLVDTCDNLSRKENGAKKYVLAMRDRNKHYQNAFHLVIRHNRWTMLTYLLSMEQIESIWPQMMVETDKYGNTPLHYVSYANNVDIMRLFSARGIHVLETLYNHHNGDGHLVIHSVCDKNAFSVLSFIIRHNLYTNLNVSTTTCQTPLNVAISKNSVDCAHLLCKEKSVIVRKEDFSLCVERDRVEILKILLQSVIDREQIRNWNSLMTTKNEMISVGYLKELIKIKIKNDEAKEQFELEFEEEENNECVNFVNDLIENGFNKKNYTFIALILNHGIESIASNPDNMRVGMTVRVASGTKVKDNVGKYNFIKSVENQEKYSKNWKIGDWYVCEYLGKGAFGSVKLGIDCKNGEKVALKFIKKNKRQRLISNEFIASEIGAVQQITHANVIRILGYNLNTLNQDKEECVMLSFEYAQSGELFNLLKANHYFDQITSFVFLEQILSALEECHNMNIIHCDLKPQNLLLDSRFQIKLADFGLSKIKSAHMDNKTLDTIGGTLNYMAPELFLCLPNHVWAVRKAGDIFSVAIILWNMLNGVYSFPFGDFRYGIELPNPYCFIFHHKYDQFWRFSNSKRPIQFLKRKRKSKSKGSSKNDNCDEYKEKCMQLKDLFQQMFEFRPLMRISIQQIRQHPWFVETKELKPKPYTFETQIGNVYVRSDDYLKQMVKSTRRRKKYHKQNTKENTENNENEASKENKHCVNVEKQGKQLQDGDKNSADEYLIVRKKARTGLAIGTIDEDEVIDDDDDALLLYVEECDEAVKLAQQKTVSELSTTSRSSIMFDLSSHLKPAVLLSSPLIALIGIEYSDMDSDDNRNNNAPTHKCFQSVFYKLKKGCNYGRMISFNSNNEVMNINGDNIKNVKTKWTRKEFKLFDECVQEYANKENVQGNKHTVDTLDTDSVIYIVYGRCKCDENGWDVIQDSNGNDYKGQLKFSRLNKQLIKILDNTVDETKTDDKTDDKTDGKEEEEEGPDFDVIYGLSNKRGTLIDSFCQSMIDKLGDKAREKVNFNDIILDMKQSAQLRQINGCAFEILFAKKGSISTSI